jgi:hypothetical protein
MLIKARKKDRQKGSIIAMVLVFGGGALLVLAGLFGFILIQLKQSQQKAAFENSLNIAEAGVNYYRWHLIHNMNDIQDGQATCCSEGSCAACGPYDHSYYDAQGALVGHFSLEITPRKICDQVLGVYVSSTGYTDKFPNYKRKVMAKYASTSVAEFSYLLNDDVWAGDDRQIYGKYHSNGGVRMDGDHNSTVTSALPTWTCTSSFGCSSSACPPGCSRSGSNCACSGVIGDSPNDDLWQFPVPPFDFNGLTNDLSRMKTLAQSKGKYFPPSTNLDSHGLGYHLILKDNGKFDIKIVTSLGRVWGYSLEEGWHWDYNIIQAESNYQTDVILPGTCGLVFTEDNLWVEGAVKGKVTVASANLISAFTDTGVVLNNNLTYTTLNGEDALSLITEKDILIPLYSPENMIAQGVFVSQKGRSVSRNHYDCSWYPDDCKKGNLTIYGSVVSDERVGTKWSSDTSDWISGYSQRYDYFDQKLATDPPPLLPYVSEDLQLISWEEVQ